MVSLVNGTQWTEVFTPTTTADQVRTLSNNVSASMTAISELANLSTTFPVSFDGTRYGSYVEGLLWGNADNATLAAKLPSYADAQAHLNSLSYAAYAFAWDPAVNKVVMLKTNGPWQSAGYTLHAYGYSYNTTPYSLISSWNNLLRRDDAVASVPVPAAVREPLEAALGAGITKVEKTPSQWKQYIGQLNASVYAKRSELAYSDASGLGGIQVFNGIYYLNGKATTLMELMFVVRVNQLFVIDNKTVSFLQQLQEKNRKIKAANEVGSIIAALTPANSSSTVDVASKILPLVIPVLEKAGYVRYVTTNGADPAAPSKGTVIPMGAIASGISGYNYVTGWKGSDNGTATATEYKPTCYEMWALYAAAGMSVPFLALDCRALKEMLPATITKLLNASGDVYGHGSGSLTQADMNAITTELKGYTSNLESDNQILQTYLDQYNNKKSEVLDALSNYVKSYAQGQQAVSRNLGAI